MSIDEEKVKRLEAAALAAIKEAYDAGGEEMVVGVFVKHHLAEIDEAYWKEHLNTGTPNAEQVLGLIQLQPFWDDGEEDEVDMLDFSLPGEVTDYVLSVSFDEDGNVEEIEMES